MPEALKFRRSGLYQYTNDAGVVITFIRKGGVHYEENGRFVVFDIAPTKIAGILPAYVVYVPSVPVWTETEELMLPEDFLRMKENIIAAGIEFQIAMLLIHAEASPQWKGLLHWREAAE